MIRRLALAFALLLTSLSCVAQEALKIGLNYPQSGRYEYLGLQQRLGLSWPSRRLMRQGHPGTPR